MSCTLTGGEARSRIWVATLASFLTLHAQDAAANGDRSDERATATMSVMRQWAAALDAYRAEFAALPIDDGAMRPIEVTVRRLPRAVRSALPTRDAWGRAIRYRALRQNYELISFGADGRAEQDYDRKPLPYASQHLPIAEAVAAADDLVLNDGRFVRRPFGGLESEFQTINAINRIFVACASFAVDNNRYPGDSAAWAPVAELRRELVPTYLAELPESDGWGRPLMYAGANGERIALASFGSDGLPQTEYPLDLPCGVAALDARPASRPGSDILQVCGEFVVWPARTEP